MRGNAVMPVFLSDAIANGRLGQTLLYIKDFRKANQLFRIILKIDSCDKLFLFFKISPGKVANCRQQISAALLIKKRRDIAIDVLIACKGGKVVHIFSRMARIIRKSSFSQGNSSNSSGMLFS